MSLEFPRLMFKNGGKEPRHGGTYSTTLVENEADYKAALSVGWHGTLLEAIEPKKDAPEVVIGSREELEAMAIRLGVKHHPSIGDDNLRKKLDEALRG